MNYESAKSIAIKNTIPDGKVYCSGDAGDFFYFVVVNKNIPIVFGIMTGSTYTAVDKKDGRVWTMSVTDPRLKNAKMIEGPKK